MFTGIIKETGRVEKITKRGSLARIAVSAQATYQEASPSDSISLNGVCLTLVSKEKGLLFFEAVEPTLKASNLKRLALRDFVNIEPSLKIGDKLGGHFVLGHVDSEAQIKRFTHLKNYAQLEVNLPQPFKKFIIENGSVALEGVSLTVKKVLPRSFTADIVPFTYANTNLKYKRAGSWLNLEFDYLLKTQINTDLRHR